MTGGRSEDKYTKMRSNSLAIRVACICFVAKDECPLVRMWREIKLNIKWDPESGNPSRSYKQKLQEHPLDALCAILFFCVGCIC